MDEREKRGEKKIKCDNLKKVKGISFLINDNKVNEDDQQKNYRTG